MPQYDVFISAKSEDNAHAAAVYDFLVAQRIAVFWSERSLPKLGQADYRRAIDHALDAATHCVVVTSHTAHVGSHWVEAEWGMFINEKRSGRKEGNLITVLFGNLAVAQLPISLRQFQVVNSGRLDDLLPFVLRPESAARKSEFVFLSYCRQDKSAVKKIATALKKAGVSPWSAVSNLDAGDSWKERLDETIRQSALFLPLISKESLAQNTGDFRKEWALSKTLREGSPPDATFVVPLVLGGEDLYASPVYAEYFASTNPLRVEEGKLSDAQIGHLQELYRLATATSR